MSTIDCLEIIDKGDYAVVEFDFKGEKVNKLSFPVMTRLKEVTDELKNSKFKAVVVKSKKNKIFIAGADIEEIKSVTEESQFKTVLEQAHSIFNAWEDLPMPTIAAIDGACLGGGCEFVISCDYRIATLDKSTRIGLPEVKLGIIPGFGGCIRLPRMIGVMASLDIILAGKSVDGKKAAKLGLVDEAVPKGLLDQRVELMVNDIIAGKKSKRKKIFKAKKMPNKILESFLGRGIVFSKAKKTVLKQSKGFYPAPLAALDVVKKSLGKSRGSAQAIEMAAFCKVAVTPISKHLINLFYLMEGIKKQTGVSSDVKPLKVEHVGVLGAGVMGGGIAQLAADKNFNVRMKDISNDALAIGYKQASDIWQEKVKRRRLSKFDFKKKMSLIGSSLDYSGFPKLDVVIEAVVEDMKIKKLVIADTVKNCKEGAIIATNTSSLSVTEMAEAHPNPKNFVGMHFFNPVHKMPLVEVIRGEHTSDQATATIFDLSKRMGKTPVVVKDGPGFLVNRLLLPWMSEALFLLEDGMSIKTLDRYFTHKFGMPMGPCRLLDEVGLDTAIKVLKIFQNSLGERIQVSALADKIKASDRLGKKNKKGFYHYNEKGHDTEVDDSMYTLLGLPSAKDSLTEEECIERGMYQMINEAARALLEDKIVETAGEVDLAMIMGTGFPPFRGGLLRYADEVGIQTIVDKLEGYHKKIGIRFKPADSLVEMAKNSKTFY